ncbi:MAG: ABC transporter ATP-binding protein [Rhodocyclaceae bacterium]|nr:ABC transporter ATP-binding protein [Rhodocyclaceae bacterium]
MTETPNDAPGRVDVRELSIELGAGADRFRAVERVSFAIPAGQFVCLLGPSGCGKSTLLGAVAGHLPAATGGAWLDDEKIFGPAPERGLVFQQHTLFPWKRVVDNVAFGLKMKGVGRAERRARARELLELVGLAGFEDKYPVQLSGGMQQRVEIARVLINRPRVLLMDEPFAALDAQTRWVMQQLLLDVWSRVKTTVVFVTHDIDEAIFLADRILVMSHRPGRIREDLAIPAGRPRGQEWLTSDEFLRLKRRCMALMRDEHERAFGARGEPAALAGAFI